MKSNRSDRLQSAICPPAMPMVRVILLLALFFSPATILAGEKRTPALKSQLVVGSELDYPPYALVNEQGRADGFSVDLFKAVAEVMGFAVSFRVGPWEEVRTALERGEIDALPHVAYSLERDRLFDFSTLHTLSYGAVFVREGEPGIRSESDLEGRKIVVMRSDIAHDYLISKHFTDRILAERTVAGALRRLAAGEGDFAFVPRLVGLTTARELGLTHIHTTGPKIRLAGRGYGFAVREGDTDLLDHLNQGLKIIKTTGRFDAIFEKWFGVVNPERTAPEFNTGLRDGHWLPAAARNDALIITLILLMIAPLAWNQWGAVKGMGDRKRILILVGIMTMVAVVISGAAIRILYLTSLAQQRAHLVDAVTSQARLIEAVARFDREHSRKLRHHAEALKIPGLRPYLDDPTAATLSQIEQAHANHRGFGQSGEFTLARRQGDQIIYLWRHRHYDLDQPRPVPFSSRLAEAMRRALSGQSGSLIGSDYRNVTVLAAYEPVAILDLGIVAKIDLSEVRTPFLQAALLVAVIGLIVILGGAVFFFRISNPIMEKISRQEIARQTAEASSRSKSEFLAIMSHEIRTPLNVLLGMSDLLQESSLSMDQKRQLTMVHNAGEHLLTIINDILDLSKIEVGAVTLEPAPLRPEKMARLVAEMMRGRMEKKGLTFIFDPAPDLPEWILGDEGRLKQILINLLGNAVKFTERGHITLKLAYRHEKGELWITIGDTGVGIGPDQLEKIFDKFTQADASISRRYGGTGLGLAISRNLVELMGGTISVNSALGRGSTFHITIPLPPGAAPAPVPTVPSIPMVQENLPPLNILLAEDSEDNQTLVLNYLKDTPWRIETVMDGQEALERVQSGGLDLVLMDIQMPIMDGYAATRQIRRWERRQERQPLPILALSAHALETEKQKSLDVGCDAHLTKPIKKKVLLDKIHQFTAMADQNATDRP